MNTLYEGYTMNPVEVTASRYPTSYSAPVNQASVAEASGFAWKDVPSTLLSLMGGGSPLSSALGMGGASTATQTIDFRKDTANSVNFGTRNSVAGNTSVVIQTGKGTKTSSVDQTSSPSVGNAVEKLPGATMDTLITWAVFALVALGAVWVLLRKK